MSKELFVQLNFDGTETAPLVYKPELTDEELYEEALYNLRHEFAGNRSGYSKAASQYIPLARRGLGVENAGIVGAVYHRVMFEGYGAIERAFPSEDKQP